MILTHLGPLFMGWSIFVYGYNFAEIFACTYYSAVSLTPLCETPRCHCSQLCHWHHGVKISCVIALSLHQYTYGYLLESETIFKNALTFLITVSPRWHCLAREKIGETILFQFWYFICRKWHFVKKTLENIESGVLIRGKKLFTYHVVPNCLRTPNSKI